MDGTSLLESLDIGEHPHQTVLSDSLWGASSKNFNSLDQSETMKLSSQNKTCKSQVTKWIFEWGLFCIKVDSENYNHTKF